MITEELNLQSKRIEDKFRVASFLQDEMILRLLKYHNKREFISEDLNVLAKLKKDYLAILKQNYKLNCDKFVCIQIEDTLNRFALNENMNITQIQESFLFFLEKIKWQKLSGR